VGLVDEPKVSNPLKFIENVSLLSNNQGSEVFLGAISFFCYFCGGGEEVVGLEGPFNFFAWDGPFHPEPPDSFLLRKLSFVGGL